MLDMHNGLDKGVEEAEVRRKVRELLDEKFGRVNDPKRSQRRLLSRRSYSRRAKGEKFQREVVETLRKAGKAFELKFYDIVSGHVSANGLDVRLSERAQRLYGDLRIEVKHQEKLVIATVFQEHAQRHEDGIPILVHKRTGTEPTATLRFDQLIDLLLAASIYIPVEQAPDDAEKSESPETSTSSQLDSPLQDMFPQLKRSF